MGRVGNPPGLGRRAVGQEERKKIHLLDGHFVKRIIKTRRVATGLSGKRPVDQTMRLEQHNFVS